MLRKRIPQSKVNAFTVFQHKDGGVPESSRTFCLTDYLSVFENLTPFPQRRLKFNFCWFFFFSLFPRGRRGGTGRGNRWLNSGRQILHMSICYSSFDNRPVDRIGGKVLAQGLNPPDPTPRQKKSHKKLAPQMLWNFQGGGQGTLMQVTPLKPKKIKWFSFLSPFLSPFIPFFLPFLCWYL